MRWMIGMLLSAGCAPRFTIDDEPRCDVDYLDWAGGLTYDVLQGNGDGRFDYDPGQGVVVQVEGDYDLSSGDLEWERTYAIESYRRTENAEGRGTLWTDGDLDLEYDYEVSFVDVTRSLEVRDIRLGCEFDRRTEDSFGYVDIYRGTLTDSRLDYIHEFADGSRVFTADGVRRPDGTWSEVLEYQDETLNYDLTESGDLTDWSWEREIDYQTAELRLAGTTRRRPNGRLAVAYRAEVGTSPGETWDYAVDASGNGSGTLTFDDDTPDCKLSFERGVCTVSECSITGECVPPLRTDEVLLRL